MLYDSCRRNLCRLAAVTVHSSRGGLRYQDQIILDRVLLRGSKSLEQMAACLAKLHKVGTAHDKANNWQFFCDQYVGLLLLYFFNPTVRTLRGKRKLFEPVLLVEIQTGTSRLVLLTDQLQMPADLIALAYRYRWSIESFFRWFKCILGCRHLLGESLNALRMQVYAGLIASLLLSIWANQKPTRRTFEMVRHYMAGWATEEELQRHLSENSRQPSGP